LTPIRAKTALVSTLDILFAFSPVAPPQATQTRVQRSATDEIATKRVHRGD